MATCIFCGNSITVGTGKMYVQKDSKILWFCSRRCEKNLLKLNRTPRDSAFTAEGRKYKVQRMAAAANEAKAKEQPNEPKEAPAKKPAAPKKAATPAKKAAAKE